MSNRTSKSMQDLLSAALRKSASAEPGGGTSSQVTAPSSDKPVTEGPRAKEQDAYNKEIYGETGAAAASKVNEGVGDLNPATRAAKVLPTGEDPAAEKKETSIPAGADPGTSLQGATLGGSTIEKAAAWRNQAADLIVDLLGDSDISKVAGEMPDFMKKKMEAKKESPKAEKAEEKMEDKEASEKKDESAKNADNIYLQLTDTQDQAMALYGKVASEIADAAMFGRAQAQKVAAYLLLQKKADDEEGEDEDEGESKPEPKAEAKSEPDGDEAASAAAPEMGGEGGDLAGIEQIIAALSPEEKQALVEALMGEMGGMGGDMGGMGGDEMGGMPEGEDPTHAALGELSGEMGMSPEEMSAAMASAAVPAAAKTAAFKEAQKKAAFEAEKNRVKKQARAIVEEVISRGRR